MLFKGNKTNLKCKKINKQNTWNESKDHKAETTVLIHNYRLTFLTFDNIIRKHFPLCCSIHFIPKIYKCPGVH